MGQLFFFSVFPSFSFLSFASFPHSSSSFIVSTDNRGSVSGLGPCWIDFGSSAACNAANGGGRMCTRYSDIEGEYGYCECNAGFSGTQCQTGL